MATKIIKAQITQRRDTLANWASVNPVLLPGELGFVTDDVNRYKIGDGVHAWNDLPFRGFDGALAQGLGDSTTAAISQKAVTDELKKKVDTEKLATINGQRIDEGGNIEIKVEDFDKEGNYPLLHVGTADDLAGRGESVPASFGFRASGGKSIKDGRAYIKRIKGNSVVWNQMNESPDFSMLNSFNAVGGASHTSANGVLSVTLGASNYSGVVDASIYSKIQVNHTYLFITRAKANTTLNNVAIPYISSYGISPKNTLTTSYQTFAKIFKVTANSTTSGPCRAGEVGTDFNAGDVIDVNMYCVIDLTQMFQAGNEPTTIEDFNARVATLGIDMNAYNEGEVIHMNTESIKSVGDNAWDEEWESGRYEPSTGLPNLDEGIRSKNRIKVLPNEVYWCSAQNDLFAHFYDAEGNLIKTVYGGQYNYLPIKNKQFTTPTNAATMTIYVVGTTTYNNDIMITLVHSGWKQDTDAGYQPYWQDILPLPIIRKYFPDGMKSVGSAHDEIRFNKASGKWEAVQRIGSVDMGTLNWVYNTPIEGRPHGYLSANIQGRAYGKSNILCDKYIYANADLSQDKSIYGLGAASAVIIADSAYTDAATFKADMAGVILYYESNDWEWVELDEADQNFRDYYNVADFGTEMSQSSVPSAAFSADIIYQFNAVDMIREHELEITELQNIIATMQAQLASLASMNDL